MKKLCLLVMLFFPLLAHGQNVLTQHNDNGRTGQNLSETILTPSNVKSRASGGTFGKLFSMSVDGYVYAQPLYKAGVTIGGVSHNVVFVATEGDSVYAFDADTGAQLWHVSLLGSGETTVSTSELQTSLGDAGCDDLTPQIGITSTPVIDPNLPNAMYVEAKSRNSSSGTYIHRLHMLDITSGAEISPSPKTITASVPGTGDGGSTVTFNALHQLNRPGLLLSNGTIYIGYASHCDDGPWHGWLLAYNSSTLAQTAVFNSTPNGGNAGIWMSGAGISADSSGNIFVSTGNGDYDPIDYGDSIVKLTPTLSVTDYFTPFDTADLQSKDFDLASGGVLLLPEQSGAHPDELILGAKGGQELDQTTDLGGIIYVLNRDQLTTNNTHFCHSSCNNTDPDIVQEIQHVGNIVWLDGIPAYWNNTVYFWGGSGDVLRAYTLTNGLLSISPTSSGTVTSGFPGATPSVSAEGTTNGIVWAIQTDAYGSPGPAILRAFQATNVANQLYASNQSGSDTAGNAVKFAVPTIANGKVYAGTQGQVNVYGLLGSGQQQAATPTITPGSGTETSPVTVTLTDTTSGATITYTTDGTTPIPGSHGTAISSGGSFSVSFASTATVQAIASASGMSPSAIATATYTTQSGGGGGPSYGSGFTSTGLTLNGNAALNGTRLRLTDGGAAEAGSAFFNTLVNVQSFTTNFSFQLTNATADGIIFTIQGNSPTALGQNGAKLGWAFGKTGTSGIGNSVAVKFDIYNNDGEGTDSTGMFTDGIRPTIPAVDMTSSGLSLLSGDVMNVSMTYNGTTLSWTITDTTAGKTFTTSAAVNIPSFVGGNTAYVGFTGSTEPAATATQDILTWTYTSGSSQQQAATPTITPGSGTETSPVTVTLTDTTSGATITYTTDGTTPIPGSHGTAISSGGSFSVSFASTATVQAIASASGMSPSAIATATYTTQSGGGGGPSYGSGFTSTGLTLNGNAALNGTRLRLTDGGAAEAGSAFFNTLVNVQSFTTNFSFQLTNATADGIIFTIQGNSPTALGQNGAKLGWAFGKTGTSGIGNSVAVKFDIYNNDGEGTDSTGMFTDGIRPTIPAVDMTSSGLSLLSGDVMNVSMTYNGTTLSWTITDTTAGKTFTTSAAVNIPSFVGGNTAYVGFTGSTEPAATATQDILTWTYTSGSSQQQAATPTITPGSGTETSPVTVTLTDTTSGATITYTTDGTTPIPGSHGTAISSGGSFSVSFASTATVQAIASASGMSPSAIATATYTTQSGGGGGPSYGSGFTSTGLTLNGNAALNGTRLRLTDGGAAEAGSAFFNTLVNVTSFTNAFTFQDTSASADGLCFVIEGSGPTALGGKGGSLGYVGGSGALSTNSLCVAFDLYNNSSATEISNTGLFTDGASPAGGAGSAAGSLSFQSGDVMSVQMSYNGTTLTMQIADTVTSATYSTSFTVNIPSVVGGNTAYVGFTGGSGTLTAIQDILTWTFVPGT